MRQAVACLIFNLIHSTMLFMVSLNIAKKGTAMQIPDWADEGLSRDLPILRSRGESQDMEYKEKFPDNARDLGKEIAAFASSNSGTILIGVADSGDLVGLPSCLTPEGRDLIIQRLAGISKGTVKPAITPMAKFAVEGNAVVLVLTVPKGSQPMYYSSNTPYVRHLTEARPAEPHEVVERVAEFLRQSNTSQGDLASDKKSDLYSQLARILAEVLVFVDESQERQINPWLDLWRSEFSYSAKELRDLAASQAAIEEGINTELKELAERLDHAANLRLHLGAGGDLSRATEQVGELASSLMNRHITNAPLSKGSMKQIFDLINSTARKLSDLSSRSEEMVNSGRIEELQSEASNLGHVIAKISFYNIDPLGKGLKSKLRNVGHLLHLTETMRLYMDGGMSVRAVVDRVKSCSEEIGTIASKLGQ